MYDPGSGDARKEEGGFSGQEKESGRKSRREIQELRSVEENGSQVLGVAGRVEEERVEEADVFYEVVPVVFAQVVDRAQVERVELAGEDIDRALEGDELALGVALFRVRLFPLEEGLLGDGRRLGRDGRRGKLESRRRVPAGREGILQDSGRGAERARRRGGARRRRGSGHSAIQGRERVVESIRRS